MSSNKTPFSGISERVLELACQVLEQWNTGDLTLDDCIDDLREQAPPAEARAAASILFSYFHNKAFVDNLLLKASSRGRVTGAAAILGACALTQALFQTGIAPESAVNIAVDFARKGKLVSPAFLNALLRQSLRIAGEKEKPYPFSFPEKLQKRWKRSYGPAAVAEAAKACRENPPQTFRLRNPSAVLPEGCAEFSGDFTGDFRFFTVPDTGALIASQAFAGGAFYIQDPATAMSVNLCGNGPFGSVLDACAAPGGKTVMLSERFPQAQITAADKSPHRIRQMRENFKRLSVRAETLCADALENRFEDSCFDLVFADVPCTNTGVGRRRPDALWRFSFKRLESTVKLQRRILANLAKAVRPGGILLYSTCSIEPDENELQVRQFLHDFPQFELETERTLLPTPEHDGAFAARLRRKI